ncbi:MAG: hypothetical protein JEZ07_09245 [Phycisphaerae bacterium]|nr:hypothetical protein [Phycisphaerae bacterium]
MKCQYLNNSAKGMTLLELSVIMTIIALTLAIVPFKSAENIRKTDVSQDVQQFADTMRDIAEHAVLTGKSFELVLDITDCVYNVYEAGPENQQDEQKKTDISELTDDELLEFEDDDLLLDEDEKESIFEDLTMLISFIEEIEFSDGSRQYSGELIMRATPGGWDKSVLFQTMDDENEYMNFIRLDEGTPRVTVSEFDLEIQESKKNVGI